MGRRPKGGLLGLCPSPQQLVLGPDEEGLGQGERWLKNRPFSAAEPVYGNISSELRLIYWIYLNWARCPVSLGRVCTGHVD